MNRSSVVAVVFLTILLVFISILAFAVLSQPHTQKPSAELTEGSFIKVPMENQVFQRQNPETVISIVVPGDPTCSLDGKLLDSVYRVAVTTGEHTLECSTDTERDSVKFFVGDLFVITGQSNAVGASLNPELEPAVNERSVIYDPFKRAFVKLGFNKENKAKGIEIGGSAWPSFANTYTDKAQVHLGLIGLTKVAPIATYYANREFPKSDYFYSFFINELEKLGPVNGIIMYHGESAEVSDVAALSYKKDLLKFISYVRQDIGYQVPFYLINIGRMKNITPESEERLKIIRQGIEEIAAEEKDVFIVARAEKYSLNCEEKTTSSDCVHLGQNGQNELGVDVANFLVEKQTK